MTESSQSVEEMTDKNPYLARNLIPRTVEDEIKESYINYAMSVIVGRAIPDARDGLKPVHRRILYGMHELGLHYNKPYRKSARIVGDVLGKYHPHGDSAVYDSLVRMAQDFSLRYPLVDGQGNFGSVDGDSAAAMRYTEARMARITEAMLEDMDKDTVDFQDNFDSTLQEPTVLPAKLPNLLVNGSNGIAVGMATNMAPHNLNEICNAVEKVIDDPDVEIDELMQIVTGPDFPTGGIVLGKSGIISAYRTGRGSFRIRAKLNVEETKKKKRIIVTEIPYMVNKSRMLENMADLVKNKILDGITDIRDESDRNGIRVVIDLRRDAVVDVVLNNLYKHTQLETSFGIINLALVDQKPRVLNLKELLKVFIDHRFNVLTRKYQYELAKAKKRAHILEGLIIAVDNIDEVIKIIRGSKLVDEARRSLMERFEFSEEQAKAILEMRLQKLTGLEIESLKKEYNDLLEKIKDIEDILAKPERRYSIIKDEMEELKATFGDARRTEISLEDLSDIDMEDLIPVEDIVVTITNRGYIKRTPLEEYKSQKRGGKGLKGMDTKEEDYLVDMFICTTHDWIMFFSSKGRVYWLKGYKIPAGGRHAIGRPIVNILPRLDKDETIKAILPIKEFDDKHYLFFSTKNGLVKKTVLSAYSRPTVAGINAIKLKEGDELVDVALTDGKREIILASRYGQANRFDESEVRPMGRVAAGVRGMRFKNPNDEVVSMAVVKENQQLLTVTENGYGKRSPVEDYRKTHRGSAGVITIKTNFRNGPVLSVISVKEDDEIILTSREGLIIRAPVRNISVHGRNTMGVIIMKLNRGDVVQSVAKLTGGDGAKEEDTDQEEPDKEESNAPEV